MSNFQRNAKNRVWIVASQELGKLRRVVIDERILLPLFFAPKSLQNSSNLCERLRYEKNFYFQLNLIKNVSSLWPFLLSLSLNKFFAFLHIRKCEVCDKIFRVLESQNYVKMCSYGILRTTFKIHYYDWKMVSEINKIWCKYNNKSKQLQTFW